MDSLNEKQLVHDDDESSTLVAYDIIARSKLLPLKNGEKDLLIRKYRTGKVNRKLKIACRLPGGMNESTFKSVDRET